MGIPRKRHHCHFDLFSGLAKAMVSMGSTRCSCKNMFRFLFVSIRSTVSPSQNRATKFSTAGFAPQELARDAAQISQFSHAQSQEADLGLGDVRRVSF